MRRSTKVFLLAGCALVLALEGPRTLAGLAAGWNGPYGRTPETRTAAAAPLPAGLAFRGTPAALLGAARR